MISQDLRSSPRKRRLGELARVVDREAGLDTGGQALADEPARRGRAHAVLSSASPSTLTRRSISDFSMMNGGAIWIVSPP
jgi:hypothetical protein